MRRTGNFHVSRFVGGNDGDEDRPFAIFFSRLDVVGARFVVGRVGLPPSRRVIEMPRRYRKASRQEAQTVADSLNCADLSGEDPKGFRAALAS